MYRLMLYLDISGSGLSDVFNTLYVLRHKHKQVDEKEPHVI